MPTTDNGLKLVVSSLHYMRLLRACAFERTLTSGQVTIALVMNMHTTKYEITIRETSMCVVRRLPSCTGLAAVLQCCQEQLAVMHDHMGGAAVAAAAAELQALCGEHA
jgi:hypothetical protein